MGSPLQPSPEPGGHRSARPKPIMHCGILLGQVRQ
jgi:hypothetical protein